MLLRLMLVVCLCPLNGFSQSEMQKLATLFSGRWMILDQANPSSEHPNGLTRRGEERWYTLGGGVPLVEEYHSRVPDGAEEFDNATFWWDATAHRYAGLFCAQFVDQGCAPFNIQWGRRGQGSKRDRPPLNQIGGQDEIIMSGEYRQNGRKQVWREVFVFSSPTAFTQTLYVGEKESKLNRSAVISATRAGGIPDR